MAPDVWDEEPNDGKPEFDPDKAGPEYHMYKKRAHREHGPLSRCLICNMPQVLRVYPDGVYGLCLNKKCYYVELILEFE